MKVAVMQPYFFPYIGYFQLINNCDSFIFLDNVQYISRGWVNRNKILVNGNESYISIPVQSSSRCTTIQNKLIASNFKVSKMLKTIRYSYAKNPFFNDGYPIVKSTIEGYDKYLSSLSIKSIVSVSKYLGLTTQFYLASEIMSDKNSQKLDTQSRIINLVKKVGGNEYINMRDGENLYDLSTFKNEGIVFSCLDAKIKVYYQSMKKFVPRLSIIDLLMNLSPQEINGFCNV